MAECVGFRRREKERGRSCDVDFAGVARDFDEREGEGSLKVESDRGLGQG